MNHKILNFLQEWKIDENIPYREGCFSHILFPLKVSYQENTNSFIITATISISVKYERLVQFEIQIHLNNDKFEKLICNSFELRDEYLKCVGKLKADLQKLYE